MTASYLPPKATIEQSCQWLASNTGETWTLPRLLEYGLTPWFWLDYQEGHPELFCNRVEGFLAPVWFTGDLQRLSVDCHDVVLTRTCTPDGRHFSLCPGVEYPVDALRFLREDIQRLAGKFSATAADPSGAPEKPAPEVAPAGISKREILAVGWPLPQDAPPLQNILDEVPKWVEEACIKVGRRGKGADGSHLWNPALLAVCLTIKTPQKKWAAGVGALTYHLRTYFPDYIEQWEEADMRL